jgi:hypothetical protein
VLKYPVYLLILKQTSISSSSRQSTDSTNQLPLSRLHPFPPTQINMQFTKVLALVALFAGAAFAAPAADAAANPPPPPPKPTKPVPTTIAQTNACGNGVTPYCCNTDNQGWYTSCYAMGESALTFPPFFYLPDPSSFVLSCYDIGCPIH